MDSADNCLTVPNGPAQAVGQLDADQDGIGNACDVDYDNSGTSTTLDFAIFLTALKGGPTSVTDHDGSGTTTLVDYATFLGQYGRVPGPSGLPCANPLLKVAAGDSPCVSDEDVLPVGVVMQNSQEALAADLARLADGKGMTLDEATNAIHFQESFVEYAKDIDVRFPDQISRIWMRKSPQRGGFIEFVGDVPPGNRPSGVTLLGDGVLTRSEHEMRAELAADALKAAGHVDFLTFFDMPRDVIQLEMVVPPGSTPPPVQDLVATVRAALAADQTLRPIARLVAPSDVDVRFLVRDGPIYEFEYARGGNWLQVDGFQSCTSGWVVDGPDGDGIITAAHCVGLNEFAHTGGAVYEIVWRDQELDKGDAEYHTTTGFSDLAEFYASDTEIRDVEELKETIWMLPGSDVCVYGRSSNVRDCTHEVEATGVTTVMNPGSITVRKLVRASGDSTIGGDSGGGWSWSTKAWGVHSGSNGTDSYFTPIHRAEDELNVDVMLAP